MILTTLAVAACATAPVQETGHAAPPAVHRLEVGPYDRHASVHYDTTQDGTIWARGRHFKASANSSGFTFIPFLGSDAPRNFPVRMRLASIRRGIETLAADSGATASRTDDRLTLDRGCVQVRYDLTPEDVEQSFVIEAAPGAGDLVLSIEIDTDLEVAAQGGGFVFSNERGGVSYGAATVIDATGRALAAPTTWTNERLDLTVSEAFLDQAAWPIVVDPLLTPFQAVSSGVEIGRLDAAFDLRESRYVAVAEERFSATDYDVLTWYLTLDGAPFGATYIDQTTDRWEAPRVSVELGSFGIAHVVAEGPSAAFPGSTDIVWRERLPNSGLLPTRIAKSATSAYSCASPDIGTDGAFAQGSSQLVAYNRVYPGHRDVHSFGLANSGTYNERTVAASAAVDHGRPRVSSTSGLGGSALNYIVGWAAREIATGASSVHTAQVFYNASQVQGPYTIVGPSTTALYFDVEVSSEQALTKPNRPPYLVTFDDRPSDLTDSFIAFCSAGDVDGLHELHLAEHADRSLNQNSVRIIENPDRFMLGYEESGSLYMTTIRSIDGELAIVERRAESMTSNISPGSLGAAAAINPFFGSWNGIFLWSSQTSPTTTAILGARAIYPDSPAAGVQYCYGEANSTGDRGFIRATGSRSIARVHTLHVEALPPNVFGYYLASLSTGLVPNAGGSMGTLCVSGSVGRFGIFQADASGASSRALDPSQIPQPNGTTAALPGESWHFQVWHRDAAMGSATSNFTNAVAIPFL